MLTLQEIQEYRKLAANYPNNTSTKIITRILDDMQETRRELNALRAKVLVEKGGPYTGYTLMPFGKYKGEPLHEIPDSYFRWWFRQDTNSDWETIYMEVLYLSYPQRGIAIQKLKLHDYIKTKIKGPDLQNHREGNAET